MKNILVFLSIMLVFPLFAQQKEDVFFKVIYKKEYPGNTQNFDDIKNPMIKREMKTLVNTLKIMRYSLLIKNEESIFKKRERMQSDLQINSVIAEVIGDGKGIYYFNKKDKELLHQQKQEKVYLISIDFPKYDWTVHQETQTIAGYTCYRATAEEEIDVGLTITSGSSSPSKATRTLEVWFAPALPSMFGPTEFVGLPGLVLKAKGTGAIYKAVSVELIENACIEKPTEGEPITEEAYGKKIVESMKRIRGY